MRIGQGFDAHAFAPERRLVLGGVLIRDHDGLAGHSDADVLSHAIGDALLGAGGLGDLGGLFPPDQRWADASSLDILRTIATALRDARLGIANVDATVIAQAPRLRPYANEMRQNVARALGIADDAVSVKATSTDGLGFTGRGEGIAAMAIALVEPLV